MTAKTAQHTPGPWRATQGQLGSIVLVGVNGRAVAKIFRDGNRDDFEANARLIAAAPELLEAAQELLLYVGAAGALGREAATRAHATIAQAQEVSS